MKNGTFFVTGTTCVLTESAGVWMAQKTKHYTKNNQQQFVLELQLYWATAYIHVYIYTYIY